MDDLSDICIEVQTQGRARATLVLSGEVTLQTLPAIRAAIAELAAAGRKFLKVDLGAVDRIQSCAFGIFIEAMEALELQGGCLHFTNPGRQAQKIFRLLGVLVDSSES